MNIPTLKLATITFLLAITLNANASTQFQLTITNGGAMPLSPALVYVRTGQTPAVQVGQEATAGFIRLCQTGNTMVRASEIKADTAASFLTETTGLIMPGETRTVDVEVKDIRNQSLHFEAMYGKTKDVCAVGSFSSHNLIALRQHVTSDILANDRVLQTGFFTNPTLPEDRTTEATCANAASAIDCLRELSSPRTGKTFVRFFLGYLPSLTQFLEKKYGADDVQTLALPTSGAVQFHLTLKH